MCVCVCVHLCVHMCLCAFGCSGVCECVSFKYIQSLIFQCQSGVFRHMWPRRSSVTHKILLNSIYGNQKSFSFTAFWLSSQFHVLVLPCPNPIFQCVFFLLFCLFDFSDIFFSKFNSVACFLLRPFYHLFCRISLWHSYHICFRFLFIYLFINLAYDYITLKHRLAYDHRS